MLLEQVAGPAHPHADCLASLCALGFLSAISARRGDLEACERHLQKATDLAARHRHSGYWMTATAALTSAGLLAGRGELAEAETAALAALKRAQRGQARIETAAALLCLARIHARAGSAGEARARTGEARDLIGTCQAPGILTGLLAETEHLAGYYAPAPAPPSHGRIHRPDGLTAREAEVLRLLTDGNTNHEIAAELVVSIHTVERHLQNAYRKIRVRNRADAAAYIVRSGG
jgi:DNA-binding CsgD family transcriptional regulator